MIKNISQVKNISDLTSYIRFLFAKSLFDMLKIDPSNEPNEEIVGLFNFDEECLFCDGSIYLFESKIFNIENDDIEEFFINKYNLKITTDKFEEILATFKEATSDMVDVTLVDQDGGGEGGAEDCHSVLKIGGKFLKFHYSYQSYSGFCFWDENPCVEVRPQKVEVIQYR
jgi:hypothetical protein